MKRPPTEGCAQRGSFLRACTKAVRLAIHLPRMQPTSAACVRGVIMQPRHICCHASLLDGGGSPGWGWGKGSGQGQGQGQGQG